MKHERGNYFQLFNFSVFKMGHFDCLHRQLRVLRKIHLKYSEIELFIQVDVIQCVFHNAFSFSLRFQEMFLNNVLQLLFTQSILILQILECLFVTRRKLLRVFEWIGGIPLVKIVLWLRVLVRIFEIDFIFFFNSSDSVSKLSWLFMGYLVY